MTRTLADPEFVSAWFRERAHLLLPGQPDQDVQVLAVDKMSRGVSRQTWTVDVALDGAAPRRFVVRRDHEAGSIIASSLLDEYDVYRRLDGTGVPVARVLWFEDDPTWMPDGRPAYVRELVEGDWRLPALDDHSPAGDAERIRLSKEHVDKLALVHGVDWQSRGFDELLSAPPSPADCALHLIAECLTELAGYDSSRARCSPRQWPLFATELHATVRRSCSARARTDSVRRSGPVGGSSH